MTFKEEFDPKAETYTYASAFWRQQAYIRFYLKVDPETLSLEQHFSAYAQCKYILEKQSTQETMLINQ